MAKTTIVFQSAAKLIRTIPATEVDSRICFELDGVSYKIPATRNVGNLQITGITIETATQDDRYFQVLCLEYATGSGQYSGQVFARGEFVA